MKVGSLDRTLHEFESLLRANGALTAANHLKELRELFAGQQNITVVQLATRLEKGRGPSQPGGPSQTIRELQSILSGFEAVLAAANARTAVSDLGRVIRLLDGGDYRCVAEFTADAKGWLVRKTRKTLTSAGLRDQLVQTHIAALRAASHDNGAFDQAVARLSKDKAVRAGEMRELAKLYLGYEIAKKKGRGPALREIVDQQALNARQQARGGFHER
jgi:hypothetical protein